jgi:hypothetical protein
MTVSFLFILSNSTVTALLCSCWRFSFSSLRLLLLSTSYHKPASLHGRTDPVLACYGRTGQMSAFYSNVGVLLKSRRPIESHQKWAVLSLQPGVTSKSGKSKKCLEFSSDSRLFAFGISQALSRYEYREQLYAQTCITKASNDLYSGTVHTRQLDYD